MKRTKNPAENSPDECNNQQTSMYKFNLQSYQCQLKIAFEFETLEDINEAAKIISQIKSKHKLTYHRTNTANYLKRLERVKKIFNNGKEYTIRKLYTILASSGLSKKTIYRDVQKLVLLSYLQFRKEFKIYGDTNYKRVVHYYKKKED